MFIDSHAHLFFEDFKDEVPQVLARAREAGVSGIINVGTGLEESRQAVTLTEHHPAIFAAVGIHPHDVGKMQDQDLSVIETLAKHNKVVAVGEVGLDYYYEHSPQETQRLRLRDFVQLARRLRRPLILHCRDAFDDCFEILDRERGWESGGVFHCYTGDLAAAKTILKKGFYLSFSGILTFKKSASLREVAKNLPIDRLLIETDCPFLAPEPYRGKRNEPAYLVRVAETLASLQGIRLEEVGKISSQNAKTLFGI